MPNFITDEETRLRQAYARLDRDEFEIASTWNWAPGPNPDRLKGGEVEIPWLYYEALLSVPYELPINDQALREVARVFEQGMRKYNEKEQSLKPYRLPLGYRADGFREKGLEKDEEWQENHAWFYRRCRYVLETEMLKHQGTKDILRQQKLIRDSRALSTLNTWVDEYRLAAAAKKNRSISQHVIIAMRLKIDGERKPSKTSLLAINGAAKKKKASMAPEKEPHPPLVPLPPQIAASGESPQTTRASPPQWDRYIASEDEEASGTLEVNVNPCERLPSSEGQKGQKRKAGHETTGQDVHEEATASDQSVDLMQARKALQAAEKKLEADCLLVRVAQDELSQGEKLVDEARGKLMMWEERVKQRRDDLGRYVKARDESAAEREQASKALDRATLPTGHAEFVDAALLCDSVDAATVSYYRACLKTQKVASEIGISIVEKHFAQKEQDRPAKVAKVREYGDVTTGGQVDQ